MIGRIFWFKILIMDDYQNPEEKVKELEKRLEDLTKKSKEGLWQTRAIPAAIIITGFLIAVAIYYSGGGDLAVKNNRFRLLR